MRISLLAALLFCATGTLALQAQDSPSPNSAFIDGRVENAVSGEPIADVKLLLAMANGAGKPVSLETDSDGRFIFQDLAAGRYLLFGEAPGFARQAYGARGNPLAGALLSVSAGQEIADLAFKLTPAAAISGKVLDAAGEPVPKTTVMALQPVYQRGKKQYVPVAATQSDESGAYRLANLSAGRYLIAAAYRGQPAEQAAVPGQPERNYVTTFYPATASSMVAAAVSAAAGKETGDHDIHLVKVNTFRVSGKVDDPQKSAVALVWLTAKGSGLAALATRVLAPVQEDGSFEFPAVAPGSYILNQAAKDGITSAGPSIPVTVADRSVDDLTLPASSGAELSGEVKINNQPPQHLQGVQVVLEPADAPVPKPPKTAVGEDGKFIFKDVSTGRYLVHVLVPEGFYVKSMRYRNQDASEDAVDVATDASATIQVALAQNGGQASGTVLGAEGNPEPGVTVVLIPSPRRFSLFKETTTDQNGAFSFVGIAPGSYRLMAWENIEPGAYQSAAFLKPFELKGEEFVLKPGDHKTAVLKALQP